MPCSKASSGSSTSWLDRLRISKGFSLHSSTDEDPTSSPPPLPPPVSAAAVRRRPRNVAAVLSDLFVMGPPPPPFLSKASRKQSRPRPCSAASAVADHSSTEVKKKEVKPPRRKRRSRVPPAGDLSTFSKTEVTVIDTSVVCWKTEKVIFRRGTMWKVRDRKVWTAWRKKRKLGLARKGKEKNLADLGAAPCAKEDLKSLYEEDMLKDKRYASISKEAKEQVPLPRRRHNLLRSPRVPTSKDLSAYRLQTLSADTKRELPLKAKFKAK